MGQSQHDSYLVYLFESSHNRITMAVHFGDDMVFLLTFFCCCFFCVKPFKHISLYILIILNVKNKIGSGGRESVPLNNFKVTCQQRLIFI